MRKINLPARPVKKRTKGCCANTIAVISNSFSNRITAFQLSVLFTMLFIVIYQINHMPGLSISSILSFDKWNDNSSGSGDSSSIRTIIRTDSSTDSSTGSSTGSSSDINKIKDERTEYKTPADPSFECNHEVWCSVGMPTTSLFGFDKPPDDQKRWLLAKLQASRYISLIFTLLPFSDPLPSELYHTQRRSSITERN